MPELPEVETVRRGLADQVVGRHLGAATVAHPRAVRRQGGGAAEFVARTSDLPVLSANRRGKYLWLDLGDGGQFLVAHLGMSGQFRVSRVAGPHPQQDPHARVWWSLDDGRTLVFRDQRTFGWLLADEPTEPSRRDSAPIPRAVSHIAADPFDPQFDPAAAVTAIRRSRSAIKRVLLAQTIVSGIGNIYADEALWRARVHPDTPAHRLSRARAEDVLAAATDVMADALRAGGTSFDPLFVAINGDSGWFDRSLAAYGRQGQPCPRCGVAIVRERFTNRSSHRCPRCQRLPRARRAR